MRTGSENRPFLTDQPDRSAGWSIRRAIVMGSLLIGFVFGAGETSQAGLIGGLRSPVDFRSWTIETEFSEEQLTVSQFYVPYVASIALGRSADLVLSSAIASSDLDPEQSASLSLSGMSDVTAQVFFRFPGDRLLIQAGLNLPAGSAALDEEEFAVARMLGHPLLGFRLKQYGQGLNVSIGAGLAVPLGENASFALGAGYVDRGSFEFLEGNPDFEPGSEMSISLGLDFLGSDRSDPFPTLRFDSAFRIFGEDQLGGDTIFEEGNQIEIQGLAQTRPAPVRAEVLTRLVLKADNTIYNDQGSQIESLTLAAGTSLLLRGSVEASLTPRAALGLDGEFSLFSGSDSVQQNGSVYGLGPAVRFVLGESGSMRVRALYLLGQIDGDDGTPDLDLSGLDFSVALLWRP